MFNFSVLPSFEVKLTPATEPFFYVDSVAFTVNIKATYVKVFALWLQRIWVLVYFLGFHMPFSCGFRYLFGKEVDGMAYVVFGVIQGGQKKSFPSSLQRVQVITHLH